MMMINKPNTALLITENQWLNAHSSLVKRHDLELGAFYKAMCNKLDISQTKVAKLLGLSQPTINNKVNLYTDYMELQNKKIDKPLPPTGRAYQALKGDTAEAKADHYKQVQDDTGKEKPTNSDIRKYKTIDIDAVDYIYLITDGNYVKIGVTQNIKFRISQLQCGNPNKLELIGKFEHTSAYSLESQLHRVYSEHRLVGEWFDLTPEQVDNIIKGLR